MTSFFPQNKESVLCSCTKQLVTLLLFIYVEGSGEEKGSFPHGKVARHITVGSSEKDRTVYGSSVYSVMEHMLSVSLRQFLFFFFQDRTVHMFSQVDREFGNMLAKGLKKYVDT
jgi:hypothetical protein